MGRDWAPKYTEAQREALIAEVLERGETAVTTARKAAQGTLAAGLEPFAVPVPTVRDIVARRRRRLQLANERAIGPSAVVAKTCERLAAILTREVDKYERAVKNAKPTDPAKLRELARAAREIATLERTIAPKRTPVAKPAKTSTSKTEGDLLDKLAAEGRSNRARSAETAQNDATRHPTSPDSERLDAAHATAPTQTEPIARERLRDARVLRADVAAVMRAASGSPELER